MGRNHKKNNPLLAKFAAELEADYYYRLQRSMEIDYIIMLLTVNEELHVGPGRAGKFFNAFLARKMEFTETILPDMMDDPDAVYTRYKLAKQLKSMFSPEDWAKYREIFTFLADFWED